MPSRDQDLQAGGEMGARVRSFEWSKTPLGPIEAWPISLRTTVRLPLAMAEATSSSGFVAPAASLGQAQDRNGHPSRRILIVDDNEDAAWILAETLSLIGHDVRCAHDGPSALRTALDHPPEIALLDIGLPVMDGYELAARLRAEPRLAGVRLIALTGYGQPGDRQRSNDAGFAAHLVKPVSINVLVEVIDVVM